MAMLDMLRGTHICSKVQCANTAFETLIKNSILAIYVSLDLEKWKNVQSGDTFSRLICCFSVEPSKTYKRGFTI